MKDALEQPARPRLDVDDIGVVVTGAAFIALTFLPWYEATSGAVTLLLAGWGRGFAPVLAAILAGYAAARVLYMRGRPQRPDVPVTPQAETFAASAAALLLMVYRVLVVPSVEGATVSRTAWLTAAAAAIVFQAVFAARKLGRTGVRATPPE